MAISDWFCRSDLHEGSDWPGELVMSVSVRSLFSPGGTLTFEIGVGVVAIVTPVSASCGRVAMAMAGCSVGV